MKFLDEHLSFYYLELHDEIDDMLMKILIKMLMS